MLPVFLRGIEACSGIIPGIGNNAYFCAPYNETGGEGDGPGLSVAYSLAKEHNGGIPVSSEDGKGSTFTIILPLYGKVA
jgi:nitrogen-specific signal transduction histidine kinase